MCFLCVYAGYLCMCSRKCAQLHVRPETDISCLPRYSPSCFWTRGLSVDLEVTEASRSESSSNPPSLPPQGWDYRLVMLHPHLSVLGIWTQVPMLVFEHFAYWADFPALLVLFHKIDREDKNILLYFAVLGSKLKALCMLNKCSTIKPHLQAKKTDINHLLLTTLFEQHDW